MKFSLLTFCMRASRMYMMSAVTVSLCLIFRRKCFVNILYILVKYREFTLSAPQWVENMFVAVCYKIGSLLIKCMVGPLTIEYERLCNFFIRYFRNFVSLSLIVSIFFQIHFFVFEHFLFVFKRSLLSPTLLL